MKPGAGLCSPAKEFQFAFMLLMGLFIMSLQNSVDALKRKKLNVHLEELLKLLSPHVTECRAYAYRCTIICPHIIHAFFKLPQLVLYVFDE